MEAFRAENELGSEMGLAGADFRLWIYVTAGGAVH
jgi:hypothetical protein